MIGAISTVPPAVHRLYAVSILSERESRSRRPKAEQPRFLERARFRSKSGGDRDV